MCCTVNYVYAILELRTTVYRERLASIIEEVVQMVTYNDLFTFVIMLVALLAYLKSSNKRDDE